MDSDSLKKHGSSFGWFEMIAVYFLNSTEDVCWINAELKGRAFKASEQ